MTRLVMIFIYILICKARQADDKCIGHQIPEKLLKALIMDQLHLFIVQLCDKRKVLEELQKIEDVQNPVYRAKGEIMSLTDKVSQMAKKREQLYADYVAGVVDSEDYQLIRKDYSRQYDGLRAALQEAESKKTEVERQIEEFTIFKISIRSRYWLLAIENESAECVQPDRNLINPEIHGEGECVGLEGIVYDEKLVEHFLKMNEDSYIRYEENAFYLHQTITHPEERIWAEQTPPAVLRAPDAPKVKHARMKQFYMVDMGQKM